MRWWFLFPIVSSLDLPLYSCIDYVTLPSVDAIFIFPIPSLLPAASNLNLHSTRFDCARLESDCFELYIQMSPRLNQWFLKTQFSMVWITAKLLIVIICHIYASHVKSNFIHSPKFWYDKESFICQNEVFGWMVGVYSALTVIPQTWVWVMCMIRF